MFVGMYVYSGTPFKFTIFSRRKSEPKRQNTVFEQRVPLAANCVVKVKKNQLYKNTHN